MIPKVEKKAKKETGHCSMFDFRDLITNFIQSKRFVQTLVDLLIKLLETLGIEESVIKTVSDRFCEYNGDDA